MLFNRHSKKVGHIYPVGGATPRRSAFFIFEAQPPVNVESNLFATHNEAKDAA